MVVACHVPRGTERRSAAVGAVAGCDACDTCDIVTDPALGGFRARALRDTVAAMSKSRRDLHRRDVLRGGIAAAAFAALPGCGNKPSTVTKPEEPVAKQPVKKKILILGGTGFLGPKTVEVAIARGHEVTIFNRGKREKFLPLEFEVEHLYGNRDPELPADDERGPDGKLLHPDATPKGLEQLVGRTWDVVIDNSGYIPRHVKASAELLAKQGCGQYIFISSISAYDEASIPADGGTEDVKLATLADPTVEEMGAQFENYGGLKVLCEQAAEAAFPGRATIVRPGYIVGPGDPTDRFTYWPVRIQRGGEVLAPGTPDDPLQWIDVRDLAAWLVHLAEEGTAGAFHAVGPTPPGRWGDVLQTCIGLSKSNATLTWVPADWLEKNAGEDAFPIWAPPTGKYAGFHRWNNARARAAGLELRPIEETVRATLAWFPTEIERRVRVTAELAETNKAKGLPPPPDPTVLRAGPPPAREQELLEKYKSSKPG
jgi:2'-hydroxyisoflavone reductase